MLQPSINDSAKLSTLYVWIYTFHMPAFIFLSGFFAKGSGSSDYIVKMVKKLLVPYLLFQALYTGFYLLMGREAWQGVIEPQWSLWFLLSLFSWHMLLVVFKKFPPIVGIGLALAIGVIVGYFPEIGQTLSLSRTFVFFPFFLMGYWCSEGQLMRVRTKAFRYSALLIAIVVAGLIYIVPDINTGWLLASKSYADLDMPIWGGIGRIFVYTIAIVMSISVLSWIPKRDLIITPIGKTTLYVYLLHGFFIQYFRHRDLFEVSTAVDFIGVGFITAAIVLLLSNKKVRAIWQPLIEGKTSLFKKTFKRNEQQQY